MSILGFDLGTGACKGVAFDENGTILAKAEKSYQTYSRYPGWCELDPQNFIDVIREIALYIRSPRNGNRKAESKAVLARMDLAKVTLVMVDKVSAVDKSDLMNGVTTVICNIQI